MLKGHAHSLSDGRNGQPFDGKAPVAMMSNQRQSMPAPGSPDSIRTSNGQHSGGTMRGSGREPQRILPDKDVSRDTIEDAYVQFIFFTNPSIPRNTDSAELRKGFNSVPKTDGQTFSVFTVFELIRKLENKEIETWTQLIMDMGVEPPDVASGQSPQKLQQYAVRLKRWLHAFHIDAFFQYCMDKPSPYFTDIPYDSSPSSKILRDGVPPDEDLALRALIPEWRPKRGRKRNDDGYGAPNPKRQLRAASVAADENMGSSNQDHYSSHPQSAFPWDRPSNQQRDPWAAAVSRSMSSRPQEQNSPPTSIPGQPYESGASFYLEMQDQQSGFPKGSHSAHPGFFETGSPPRSRKKPGISAAWNSNDGSAYSKPRGRPPSNRSHLSGEYFGNGPPSAHPGQASPPMMARSSPAPQTASSTASMATKALPRKPRDLQQLQVPQRAGRTPRLATPPAPRMTINGQHVGHQQQHHHHHLHQDARAGTPEIFPSTEDDDAGLGISVESDNESVVTTDWRRKAYQLARRVKELETELRNMKKRVLEAVM